MFSNVKMWWESASVQTRIGLAVGTAFIVLVTIFAFTWVFKDDYQILFSELNAQDASVLVSELDKSKTPYQLADSGNTILVPKDIVYKTRLKLMGQNIPLQGGVGFEIFNNSDFGMTEFAQKVNYQRALQGELARTIMALEEIKFARVHIVLPESGLFKKQKVSPKASVTLVMKPDAQLRPEQVVGIQRLVAASVPEIEISAVTVLEQGVALSKNMPPVKDDNGLVLQLDMADSFNQRQQVKKQTEAYLTRKLSEVLEKAIGPGQAIVTVDVNLNYDHVKITQESVLAANNHDGDATGVIVRRRQSTNIIPSTTAAEIGNQGSDGTKQAAAPQQSTTSEVDYQTGRRIEQIVTTPGSILRINVGVLIPGHPTEEMLRRIKDILQVSAGINLDRGDAIAVYGLDEITSNGKARESMVLPPLVGETNKEAATVRQANEVPANVSKPWAWALIFVIIFLILGAVAYQLTVRRQHANTATPLTPQQREEMLRDIRSWLNQSVSETGNSGVLP